MTSSDRYYIESGEGESGPFTLEQLEQDAELTEYTLVRLEDEAIRRPLGDLLADRAAEQTRSASRREALAIVEVPPDPRIFTQALLLLQPIWVRIGGHMLVLILGVGFVAAVGDRWPDLPRVAFRVPSIVVAALLFAALFAVRRHTFRAQVERWSAMASRAGGDHIAIDEDGFVRNGARIPWSDVVDAAELDSAEAMLLAVHAQGSWLVLPASCFKQGDFRGAQSLLLRKLGDKLRIVQQ